MYKICIADDEAYIVKSIEQRILQSGFVVEIAGCAANGAEALELYQEQKPIFLCGCKYAGNERFGIY